MEYLQPLTELFHHHANAENATQMQNYVRDLFSYYGIKAPLRKEITKDFIKKHGIPAPHLVEEFAQAAWNHPQREMQYFGVEVIQKMGKKLKQEQFRQVIVYTITHKSWWDTVDFIASHLAGQYFQTYPEDISPLTNEWMASNHLWLQRVCLLFQLRYKTKTNVDLLFDYALQLSSSKEFFIQKAIGWALRQYARTAPDVVKNFVETHAEKLPALSKREALKHFKKTP